MVLQTKSSLDCQTTRDQKRLKAKQLNLLPSLDDMTSVVISQLATFESVNYHQTKDMIVSACQMAQ